jgi:hypothetical protein
MANLIPTKNGSRQGYDIRYGETAIAILKAKEAQHDWLLIVLSAGAVDEGFNASARIGVTALHANLADTLSTQGQHRIVEGAEHIPVVTREARANSGRCHSGSGRRGNSSKLMTRYRQKSTRSS